MREKGSGGTHKHCEKCLKVIKYYLVRWAFILSTRTTYQVPRKGKIIDRGANYMVRVWFGDKKNAIYNTSVFFKNRYKDEWITDEFARKVIMDVDHSEVVDANIINSPVLGNISPLQLSGGVKALILMKHFPGKVFNASNCGDNCAKWILELGEEQDFTINLFHVMNFGKEPFQVRILNSKSIVAHNMQEFLNAGVEYLREGM